jgi:excisionase family DNA binding protein
MTLTVAREFLTVAEAAALWRVSVPTVYRRVAAGDVPHIRIGTDGPIRIPASAILEGTPLERRASETVSVDGSPAGAASPAQTPQERRGTQKPGKSSPPAHAGLTRESDESR